MAGRSILECSAGPCYNPFVREERLFYLEVLESLQKKGVRYLVVGGLAVNLHGVPRMTQDMDLIIALDADNVERLISALTESGFVPRLPEDPKKLSDPETLRKWKKEKNMIAFSFYHKTGNYRVVDVVIDQPLDFAESEKRMETRTVGAVTVRLVSQGDLEIMKKKSGRPQDIADLKMLREAAKIPGDKNA